ncbi:prepilin-type N-terminal cleavage/methylation domain-containing protein [Candidatus Kaiserbacteria bacterium]|nr:prepilin-type N-terminal cleavage/methylation domain-containing protein [Candidatus Kaiserbacteria bacterium]
MPLRKTSIPKDGFTLVEILVVVGMLAIVAGTVAFFDLASYEGEAFRGERTTLVTLLETARADALNNVDESQHGVHVATGQYTLFEGESYSDPSRDTSRDVVIAASYVVTISPSGSDIVFAQLSAETSDATITLTDPARKVAATITINREGGISW